MFSKVKLRITTQRLVSVLPCQISLVYGVFLHRTTVFLLYGNKDLLRQTSRSSPRSYVLLDVGVCEVSISSLGSYPSIMTASSADTTPKWVNSNRPTSRPGMFLSRSVTLKERYALWFSPNLIRFLPRHGHSTF